MNAGEGEAAAETVENNLFPKIAILSPRKVSNEMEAESEFQKWLLYRSTRLLLHEPRGWDQLEAGLDVGALVEFG